MKKDYEDRLKKEISQANEGSNLLFAEVQKFQMIITQKNREIKDLLEQNETLKRANSLKPIQNTEPQLIDGEFPIIPDSDDDDIIETNIKQEIIDPNEAFLCVVCTVNYRDIGFTACPHIAICHQCYSEKYKKIGKEYKCPICFTIGKRGKRFFYS